MLACVPFQSQEWWNATTVGEYWRLWNQPVHKWMLRHVYFPCIRAGLPKFWAGQAAGGAEWDPALPLPTTDQHMHAARAANNCWQAQAAQAACRHLTPICLLFPSRPHGLLHLCDFPRSAGGRAAAHAAPVGLLGPHAAGAWAGSVGAMGKGAAAVGAGAWALLGRAAGCTACL